MRYALSLTIVLFISATAAQSAVMVDVKASSGPSLEFSPNYDTYGDNAVDALENGDSSQGSTGTPGYYQTLSEATAKDFTRSPSFTSWRADATPSGNFASEHGNALYFGFHAKGDGTTQFRLEDIQYEIDSDDSNDWFDQSGDYSGANYGDYRIGIAYGADRQKGGGDDTRYTSGNGDTLVDEIINVGRGVFFDPDGTGSEQQQLDEVIRQVNDETPFEINGSYEVFGPGGVAPINSDDAVVTVKSTPAVPEPASLALLVGGSTLLLTRRQRRS